ncbi:hypothetical protein OIU77_000271 [Salix suchowensis]|uniref:Uncharacterized protein n=1 Tax=Salix suchowensis TaxID=1278906 RepID=A0ABQ9B8P1_9ROSI|nr:hypothetical protein OIU77_000271 [Salix suchowensis]
MSLSLSSPASSATASLIALAVAGRSVGPYLGAGTTNGKTISSKFLESLFVIPFVSVGGKVKMIPSS